MFWSSLIWDEIEYICNSLNRSNCHFRVFCHALLTFFFKENIRPLEWWCPGGRKYSRRCGRRRASAQVYLLVKFLYLLCTSMNYFHIWHLRFSHNWRCLWVRNIMWDIFRFNTCKTTYDVTAWRYGIYVKNHHWNL